jgi:hypothetical protein
VPYILTRKVLASYPQGITNSGAITVSASGVSAYPGDNSTLIPTCGIRVNNEGDGTVTVNNTENGVISVSSSFFASGLYLSGDVALSNTGTIIAESPFRDSVWEVYVASGTTTLVNTYNVTVGGATTTAFYVASGAYLALNDAKLTISYVDDFQDWGTAYSLFSGDGTITGDFSSVEAVNQNVTVEYEEGDASTKLDDTVTLIYGSKDSVSPFAQSAGMTLNTMVLAGGVMDQRMVSSFFAPSVGSSLALVAAGDNVASDAGLGYFKKPSDWNFFAAPYYSNSHSSAQPTGYDAQTYGSSFGFEHKSESALCGFHMGYGSSNIDFTGSNMEGNSEDQDAYTLGVHAMGLVQNWTWRARITGFVTESDYQGRTGMNLDIMETAEYETAGIATSVAAGYRFNFGKHMVLPEVGLDYIHAHRDSFTTQASSDPDIWNLSCEALNTDQVTAVADIRWLTRIEMVGLAFEPSIAAGVRQLLSDDETSVTQKVGTNDPFSVNATQDDLSGTVSASLTISKGPGFSTLLSYDGEFGDDTSRHSVWAKFSFSL